jgi:hypothetical protein
VRRGLGSWSEGGQRQTNPLQYLQFDPDRVSPLQMARLASGLADDLDQYAVFPHRVAPYRGDGPLNAWSFNVPDPRVRAQLMGRVDESTGLIPLDGLPEGRTALWRPPWSDMPADDVTRYLKDLGGRGFGPRPEDPLSISTLD